MKICYGRRPKSGNGRLRDFASKMSPFLFRFQDVARLTHFHRSGTWLSPTDISQTFLSFSETKICFGFFVCYMAEEVWGGERDQRSRTDRTSLLPHRHGEGEDIQNLQITICSFLFKDARLERRVIIGGSAFGRAPHRQ